jgi:hypothetical protein
MLKLKKIAEGYDMILFFFVVWKKVRLFCPWVPVAKYSLLLVLLLKKKSSFLYILHNVSIDIFYNFFFSPFLGSKMNK